MIIFAAVTLMAVLAWFTRRDIEREAGKELMASEQAGECIPDMPAHGAPLILRIRKENGEEVMPWENVRGITVDYKLCKICIQTPRQEIVISDATRFEIVPAKGWGGTLAQVNEELR